jgi:WhiB family redox-sensing transcriptional regulator
MTAHDRQDWRRQAVCAEVDPELFFPEKNDTHGRASAAKKVCARCPVAIECALDAMARDEKYGTWGGMSERQRRTARRDARKAAAA